MWFCLINVFKLNKNYDIMEKINGILNKEKKVSEKKF